MRHEAVHSFLSGAGVSSVLDLGCGDGQFLERLATDDQFTRLTGIDINENSLNIAESYTRPLSEKRTTLEIAYHLGSILEMPLTLPPHQAVTMIEVIEHLKPEEVERAEELVFDSLLPNMAVFTTPAAETAGDIITKNGHQFEWTPEEATEWAANVSEKYGYMVGHLVLSTAPLPGLDLQIISFEKTE
jgi:SAM-dependent methyltransferase